MLPMNTYTYMYTPGLASAVSCVGAFHRFWHFQWISSLLSAAASFQFSLASSFHSSFVTLNFIGCLYSDLVVIAPSTPCCCFPPSSSEIPVGSPPVSGAKAT